MEEDILDKSALLEEVFNEVDSAEIPTSKKTSNDKTSGFLEDIYNLEKELLAKRKKSFKSKNEDSNSDLKISAAKSLIHEGLTDSSDDEDNKYFEESKYNECGKSLKNLMKEKTVPKTFSETKVSKVEGTWATAQAAKEKLKGQLEKLKEKKGITGNLLVEPILGMRIINPKVSSAVMREKMINRVSVATSNVKKFVDSPAAKDSDWVTGGAIVNKSTRTSQKGNPYCVWHISDLGGDIKTVCILLFGSAYQEHWKTSLGTVVGILNPSVLDGNDKSEATLRVDNAQKILVMGTSKDFGICKSKKKNGENCTSVVNMARCEFCTYHIKKEYNKACRRPDLQPPKIGRSLDNLRAKVLGKNEVFYGGKTFTAVVGKKSSKQLEKDEKRLKSLNRQVPVSLSEAQKNKDQGLLSRLAGSLETKTLTLPKPPPQIVPSPQTEIDLNFTISKKDRNNARANALKYIRQHGPLKKPVDDDRKKRTPEQISSVKRRLEVTEVQDSKKLKSDETKKDPNKERLEKLGITDDFLKMMNSEVKNNELLNIAESEEREKYFNKLEIREKMEGKMASTFKVECKAVRCLKCNYKSFSASDLCKKEKHPLKVVNAVKRFWKCGDCSARTVCLELIPLHSCKNCGSSKWERASMMAEKKGPNLAVEPLSLRGNEEKFIGAVVKNASLNLLVPEEPS